MLIYNPNPIAFEIGFLQIRWYGLIYAFGFILFYLMLYYVAKKKLIENLDKGNIDTYFLYVIICVIIGARLFEFLFYQFDVLVTKPLEIFYVWHGGLSFHGGLVGAVIAAFMFAKRYKVKVWGLLDISSLAAIFGLMLGRIGNWLNGELVGIPFNGKWCVVFSNYDAVCRHPYTIYAFLSHLLLFLVLVFILYINRNQLKSFVGTKSLSICFLIGYGVLRIVTDLFKVDDILFGLKTGQWLSFVMVVVGVLLVLFSKEKCISPKLVDTS